MELTASSAPLISPLPVRFPATVGAPEGGDRDRNEREFERELLSPLRFRFLPLIVLSRECCQTFSFLAPFVWILVHSATHGHGDGDPSFHPFIFKQTELPKFLSSRLISNY
jgi:hypothetical protein